jgi:hypothetical protein
VSMTDTHWLVGVSFAKTPLEEISAKVAQIKALGWEETGSRGDPWAEFSAKAQPSGLPGTDLDVHPR